MSFLNFLLKTRGTANSATITQAGGGTEQGGKALSSQSIYPSDLFTPGVEPYILFFVRDGVAKDAKVKERIAMYLPPTLTVTYGAQYQEIEMTLYQYQDLGNDIGTAVQSLSTGDSQGMSQAGTIAAALGARMGANVVDSTIGSNFGQQLERIQGRTVNPHMGLLFKGVDFRSFTFNFQMMARNEAESKSIKQIIQKFKYAMHPGTAAGAEGSRYWTYPDNMDIGLFSPSREYLFNLSTCVLTGMEVNYAGSGIPSFFTNTGAPVDIRMSLTFKELEVLTKERIKDGY